MTVQTYKDIPAAIRAGAFCKADLRKVSLNEANLKRANLKRANLAEANLEGAIGTPSSSVPEGWEINSDGVWRKKAEAETIEIGGKTYEVSEELLSALKELKECP